MENLYLTAKKKKRDGSLRRAARSIREKFALFRAPSLLSDDARRVYRVVFAFRGEENGETRKNDGLA